MIDPLKSAKYVLLGFVLLTCLAIVCVKFFPVMFFPQVVDTLLSFEKIDVSTPEEASKVLSELTGRTGVVFPAGTHLLNAAEERGRDYFAYYKIEFEPEDFEAFLRDSTIATIDLYDSTSGQSYSNILSWCPLRWWKVSEVKSWKTGETSFPDGSLLVLLIDYDHTDKYIIYLAWGFL